MLDVCNGRFSVLEIILEDRLYKTVDTATGSLAAVKRWESGESSFENELSALTSLRHPSVPQFICSFEEEGFRYIAEEWLDGVCPGPEIPAEQLTGLAVSSAEFLLFLSTDIDGKGARIHGDIKPSNLIIKDGRICFVDFESSIITGTEAPDSSASGAAPQIGKQRTVRLASEYFTAPEVFYGKACAQSDIYSLGMVFIWLLGGFGSNGADPMRIPEDCALKPILMKCISYEAKDRYPDAAALLTELKALTAPPLLRTEVKPQSHQAVRFSLYVDCNVCFAWELAETAAVFFGMKTCILAVTGRTQRKLDYYAVRDKYYGEESVEEETQPYLFDYRSLYQRDAESWHAKGLLHKREDCMNLYFSGRRLQDELEPENELCISDLVAWGRSYFDCVIFITDRYDDKPAVRNLTASCDYTIATPLANVDDIEACKNYYEWFGGDVLYAAWEYNEKCSLPEESILLMVGEEKYLGAVSHDEARTLKRNFTGKIRPIFGSDGSGSETQYINIINRLFGAASNRRERSCVSI